MAVPSKVDPVWKKIINGDSQVELSALATKLVVQRLRQTVVKNPQALNDAIVELHTFVVEHAFAHRDFAQ